MTGVALNVMDDPIQAIVPDAEIVTPAESEETIEILTTFDSAAPGQSDLQLTLATRLNQVVCVMAPGLYDDESLPGISVKPELLPVVDSCHLYSSVPACPFGETRLIRGEGVKPSQPV